MQFFKQCFKISGLQKFVSVVCCLIGSASVFSSEEQLDQCVQVNKYDYILTKEEPENNRSYRAALLAECIPIYEKQPQNIPLKLAIGRMRLNLAQPLKALRLFRDAFELSVDIDQKSIALIGSIHAAYNVGDSDQLYTLLKLSREFDYPDIKYVQGLYGEETKEIAELFTTTPTELMLLAHDDGSDRATIYLGERFIEKKEPVERIAKLLADLVKRKSAAALRLMHSAKVNLGKSKEDFLEAHEYLDQAIASSKPVKSIITLRSKTKFCLIMILHIQRRIG